MKREQIRRWLGFPLEESCRASIEQALVQSTHRTTMTIGILILAFQALMFLLTTFRSGGPFYSQRRTLYWVLYILLFTVTLVLLLMARRLHHKGKPPKSAAYLRVETTYIGLICLWACCITLLDQRGDGGLNVYSYVTLSAAAFSLLKPWQGVLIFGGDFVFLNLLLPITQGGTHNVYSNLINSLFIAVMAFVISVIVYRSKVFSFRDKQIIEKQVAEIRLYNEQLNWMAVTDQLTQMYNRRYLERLPEETAWRGQTLAAGLMVDIDFFKQYNDTYGHVAGDSCLKSIADDIQVFIRDKNACAVRYGGEEFFICLFQCEAREAWAEAEKLRQSIQDSGFRRDDVPLGCVTVSIGVSVLENWQTDMELLIRRADVALYAAKSNGRNRVMAYEESIPAHGRA